MSDALKGMKQRKAQRGAVNPDLLAKHRRNRKVQKQLRKALAEGPLEVPQLAEKTGLPAEELFWHVNALRKFGEIEISGEGEEYLQYRLTPDQ